MHPGRVTGVGLRAVQVTPGCSDKADFGARKVPAFEVTLQAISCLTGVTGILSTAQCHTLATDAIDHFAYLMHARASGEPPQLPQVNIAIRLVSRVSCVLRTVLSL